LFPGRLHRNPVGTSKSHLFRLQSVHRSLSHSLACRALESNLCPNCPFSHLLDEGDLALRMNSADIPEHHFDLCTPRWKRDRLMWSYHWPGKLTSRGGVRLDVCCIDGTVIGFCSAVISSSFRSGPSRSKSHHPNESGTSCCYGCDKEFPY
jgi:hypothetical protein